MNNVYAVRIETTEYSGMAVFMVAAGSVAEAIDAVIECEEYDWLSEYHDSLQEPNALCCVEYGITSQPVGVLDTYECFEG